MATATKKPVKKVAKAASPRTRIASANTSAGAGQDIGFTPEKTDPGYICRDHVTKDYYGGLVDPEVIRAFNDTDEDYVYGVQRSVIVDRYGNTEQVWVLAVLPEMPGAIPGEYRKITVEEM